MRWGTGLYFQTHKYFTVPFSYNQIRQFAKCRCAWMFEQHWCLTKAFLKAADTGVGNTEVCLWLACYSIWLSNACSNSGKGAGIWSLETTAVYSEKYIVRTAWGEKSSILATHSIPSHSLAPPMPVRFFVLHPVDTGIRHQRVIFICNKILSWENCLCLHLSRTTCNFQRPSLASPYHRLQSASLTAKPTTTGRGQQAFSLM